MERKNHLQHLHFGFKFFGLSKTQISPMEFRSRVRDSPGGRGCGTTDTMHLGGVMIFQYVDELNAIEKNYPFSHNHGSVENYLN